MDEKIKNLLSEMTLVEKASLFSGSDFWHSTPVPRLGIPRIMLTDGPHGLRKQAGDCRVLQLDNSHPATSFPTAVTLAATWDRQLISEVGAAIGRECRDQNVGVILGPGANIKRSPLCGRNFEYFSEDPLLSGELAAAMIRGIQSTGVAATLKHFAVNNQETRRMTINAVVDQRTLHEIYLTGFEIAVKKGQPRLVMGAYNKLNGIYCCEHPGLLKKILRKKWGFDGVLVTDWSALNQRVPALQAGLELEMPSSYGQNDQKIIAAVQNGDLSLAELDAATGRLLTLVFAAAESEKSHFTADYAAHHQLARRAAAAGAVLLKNEEGLLPLPAEGTVGLIGDFALRPRYQGSGSSLMNPTMVENLLHNLQKQMPGRVEFAAGYRATGEKVDARLLAEAVALAERVETAVVCVGLPDLFEIEAVDRTHLRLPHSHDALVQAVVAVNPRTAVVLANGAPVEMPWFNDVPAVLETYLSGQAGGAATADLLTGRVNPSGKLAETFPLSLADDPAQPNFPGNEQDVFYREGLYVGYRYYDSAQKPVLFPFGHGLSYTTFTYSNLRLSTRKTSAADSVDVQLDITNSGERAGQEVVQVYVHDKENTVYRPWQELKAFAKIALAPGETKGVTFSLDRRAFAFFDPAQEDWIVESGAFAIRIGASSRDIRLEGEIFIAGDAVKPSSAEQLRLLRPYFAPEEGRAFSAEAFAGLYGRSLPISQTRKNNTFHRNSPMGSLQTHPLGRVLLWIVNQAADATVMGDAQGTTGIMMEQMLAEGPLRQISTFSSGMVSYAMLDAVIRILNGNIKKGIIELVEASRELQNQ